MSGKTSLAKKLAEASQKAFFLGEDYSMPNKYFPLFQSRMLKNGVKYNDFCYGTQLIFMQNRVLREQMCKDPSKTYIIDRSIYEDRHIFAHLFYELGVMSQSEYNDYRNMFEKIVRNIDPPKCFIYLDSDPANCFGRMKKRANPDDSWYTLDILKKLDYLFKHRLIERIKIINPNINIIELSVDSYKSIDVAVDEAIDELNEFLGPTFVKTSTTTKKSKEKGA